VPYAFSIVAGPLGAIGPDLITNHTFAIAQQYANSLAAAQTAAGIQSIGLVGYPGLHDVFRMETQRPTRTDSWSTFTAPTRSTSTFWKSTPNGKTLTVTSIGMNSTAQNAGIEYGSGPQAGTIFSFKVDAKLGQFDDGEE
jgi:hypothetical protein